MTGRLEGSTAIVTGGLKGIGRATAQLFLSEGANVSVFDIQPIGSEDWEAMEASVVKHDRRYQYQSIEVTSEEAIALGVAAAIQRYGEINVLVNNVGKGLDPVPFERLSLADWDLMIQLNLTSAFLCTREIIPHMKARGSGKIVNVSSQAGRSKSEVSNIPYASAKAGLLGFTRNLAFELGSFGINVNAVAPGVTLTERINEKLAKRNDRGELIEAIPLRRFGSPEDIAAAILFLASKDADYITGATIDINGGRTMM